MKIFTGDLNLGDIYPDLAIYSTSIAHQLMHVVTAKMASTLEIRTTEIIRHERQVYIANNDYYEDICHLRYIEQVGLRAEVDQSCENIPMR